MMKLITRIIIIVAILHSPLFLHGGQYVKIEKIDPSFIDQQKLNILLTLNGVTESDIISHGQKIISVHEDGSRINDPVTITKQVEGEQYLYLVFSIDSSKSISEKFLRRLKSSARAIARTIGPQDKIAVYRFDDRVSLLNTFTQNIDQIIRNINGVKRHGKKTLLYNAIYDSIALLDRVQQANKKILVFTDGKDEGSSIGEQEVIQSARNSSIPIYFISFNKNSNQKRIMSCISKETGGRLVYGTREDDTAALYRTILSCMNQRYVVSYQTRLKKDGLNHAIEIRLHQGDIQDRDVAYLRLDKEAMPGNFFSLHGWICIGIIFILLAVLFIVIIWFLNREKRYFQKQYEIEKQLLLEKTSVSGAQKGGGAVEEQAAVSGNDEGSYAHAWLYQKDGPELGKKYLLQSREVFIGSGINNGIVIDDESVSLQHAKIKNINGIYHIFDLMSEFGTFLNGKKLLRPRALHDWDEIKIGRIVLIFRGAVRPA
jgi:VWFA-related protein